MLQLILVAAMLLGVMMVRKGGFRGHGRIMGLTLIFTFISLLIVMGPSLIRGFDALMSKPTSPGAFITVLHVIVGSSALALGGLFVVNWRFSESLVGCIGRRSGMRFTISLWLIAILSGVGFYIFYYL
jgi:uncharacterized membrane protein YozB (DUF420 family)